jgi:lysophospholipid acyltransferase (LPLAT)-like uncharacterized protein
VAYFARKTGVPVLPLGVAADRAWHLPTWDRYLIPKPFARVVVHCGTPVWIPDDLPDDQACELVRNALDQACADAEDSVSNPVPNGRRS